MRNGVANRFEAQRYEAVIDGTPIAAPDKAGQLPGDPEWGAIPIQHFGEYQRAMFKILLLTDRLDSDYTIPVVVYGKNPRKMFARSFLGEDTMLINDPVIAEIVAGKRTPVIGAHHPYNFYWTSQVGEHGSGSVGDGRMESSQCGPAQDLMRSDLISAAWLVSMSSDPSQDGAAVMQRATEFWDDPANAKVLCAMTHSEATLKYTDPQVKTLFGFAVDLPTAIAACGAHGNDTCSFRM
jgi:hypothetical protein